MESFILFEQIEWYLECINLLVKYFFKSDNLSTDGIAHISAFDKSTMDTGWGEEKHSHNGSTEVAWSGDACTSVESSANWANAAPPKTDVLLLVNTLYKAQMTK